MFFITWSHIWSLSYFLLLFYFTLFFSLILYLVPVVTCGSSLRYKLFSTGNFYIISGSELLFFLTLPLVCIGIVNVLWSSHSISAWFGHILFTSFHHKILYLILLCFFLVLLCFSSSLYFSSSEVYDFFSTKYNFCYWILILFFSNSFFTVMFIIEVLSTLVFLLLVTSTFSSTFFYKNLGFNSKFFFQNLMPYTFLNSIIFLFWISLISSLNLFIFLIFVSLNLMTFDWFLLEYLFFYVVFTGTIKDVLVLGLSWFFLLFSIFLKCGLSPVFFWKPSFFKGVNMYSLIFYITFFYFFLFIYLIYFLLIYLHELFYFYSLILLVFIIMGIFLLLSVICESFYIKTFFAVSSILNSLLVLLALVPNQGLFTVILL